MAEPAVIAWPGSSPPACLISGASGGLGRAVAGRLAQAGATVIRGVLAPALVTLLGRANLWLPRPAARLLRTSPLSGPGSQRLPGRAPGPVRHRRFGPNG